MKKDYTPDEWDSGDWEDFEEPERKHSSRKLRYAFAGLLLFFMWLVRREKNNEEVEPDDDDVEIEESEE